MTKEIPDDVREMAPDHVPDACLRGNHDFGQAGRCDGCGADRADLTHRSRKSGGAGARTHPLTDEDYKRARSRLFSRGGE